MVFRRLVAMPSGAAETNKESNNKKKTAKSAHTESKANIYFWNFFQRIHWAWTSLNIILLSFDNVS
jgi:hypothetical protein